MCVKICLCACSVAGLCPTLCLPMGCNPPSSAVHGISQARILEWVAISFSVKRIFLTQGLNPCLLVPALAGRFFTTEQLGEPKDLLTFFIIFLEYAPRKFWVEEYGHVKILNFLASGHILPKYNTLSKLDDWHYYNP